MTPQEKIEEIHGIWEIAIVRLAALVEGGADEGVIRSAVQSERAAFAQWQAVTIDAVRAS